jgi:hypothetical protein
MRESPYFRSWPYHVVPVLVVAILMAVTGPFGTYLRMDLGVRLFFFVTIALLSWAQIILLAAWFGSLEPIDRWPVAARMALVGLLGAVPSTLEVVALHDWLGQPIPWRFVPATFPENALLTVVISVAIGLLVEDRLRARADAERARVADLPQTGQPAAAAPDFFRRIPPALGRDLLALEMEDHYLRIHTALGSDLILLRMRDALAELGPQRGRQVHRSWWVAQGALSSVERDGARIALVLRNGLKVPVSKSFRDQVKEAGWLG